MDLEFFEAHKKLLIVVQYGVSLMIRDGTWIVSHSFANDPRVE
jgi:hypothetical protein